MRLWKASLVAVALLVWGAAPARAADPFTVMGADGTALYQGTAAELAHWTEVAKRSGTSPTRVARGQAFQLLVSFAWLRGEAAERGMFVTHERVVREFRRQRDTSGEATSSAVSSERSFAPVHAGSSARCEPSSATTSSA